MCKIKRLNHRYIVGAIILALFTSGAAWAQDSKDTTNTVQLTYRMSSMGYPFGTIAVTRQSIEHNDKPIVEEKTVTTMDLSNNGETNTITSEEVAWIGPEGLIKYDATFDENGQVTLLKARWLDNSLSVKARLGEGDEWTGVEFDRRDFDFTTPEMLPIRSVLSAGGKATVNWLSFYEMATAPVTIEYQGKDKRNVGNRSFDCKVFVFDNPQMGLSGKIWIATDVHGPFLLREEGRSPDGPFTMQVTDFQTL